MSISISDKIFCEMRLEEPCDTSQLVTSQLILSFCTQALDGSSLVGLMGASFLASFVKGRSAQGLALLFQTPQKASFVKGGAFLASCLAEATGMHFIPQFLQNREVLGGRVEEGWGGWVHSSLNLLLMKGTGFALPSNPAVQHAIQDVLMVKIDEICAEAGLIEAQSGSFVQKMVSAEIMSCQMMVSGALVGLFFTDIKRIETRQELKYQQEKPSTFMTLESLNFLHLNRVPSKVLTTAEGINIRASFTFKEKNKKNAKTSHFLFMVKKEEEGFLSTPPKRTSPSFEEEKRALKENILKKGKEKILAECSQFDDEPEILVQERIKSEMPIVRSLFPDGEVAHVALEIYHGFLKQLPEWEPLEIYAGSREVFPLLYSSEEKTRSLALETLAYLSIKWTPDQVPFLSTDIKKFRQGWTVNGRTGEIYQDLYSRLISHCKPGESEVSEGRIALIAVVKSEKSTTQTKRLAFRNYQALSQCFDLQNKTFLIEEFQAFTPLLSSDNPLRSDLISYLSLRFQDYNNHALWQEVVPPWLEQLGIIGEEQNRLIHRWILPSNQVALSSRYWNILLTFLSDLDSSRRTILQSFLRTDTRARDAFSAISSLLMIPIEVRRQVTEEALRAMASIEIKSSELKKYVLSRLPHSMAVKIRGNVEQPRFWESHKTFIAILKQNGIFDLFSRSAQFMNDEGKQNLGDLMDDLAHSNIEGEKIIYQKRYDDMIHRRFHPRFIERWARRSLNPVLVQSPQTVEEVRSLIFSETAKRIREQLRMLSKKEEELSSLIEEVHHITLKFERGDIDIPNDIDPLIAVFKKRDREIKKFSEHFREIRVDLQQFKDKLRMGMKILGKSHAVLFTGEYDEMAKGGHLPIERCQSLLRFWTEDTNGRGQPLNRIRHGQFKMAYYLIDEKPVARRLIEVTRTPSGQASLLVYPLYPGERFLWSKEFKEKIVEYVNHLKMLRSHLFFSEEGGENIPKPLETGDEVYRDLWKETISYRLVEPQTDYD